MANLTLVQAINLALVQEMEKDDRIIILGEDIGLNGGVFRVTDGLFKRFGKDREAFERAIDARLEAVGTEIIALAGFMRVLTPWFVEKWTGRMINIHPSLLPKHKGLETHQRAIDAGDAEAGCSVHWVTAGVDEGAVIAQASVPILPGDSADTLSARILPEEHRLYPEALAKACAEILARA